MAKVNDQRYGRLTVIAELAGARRRVMCVCDCGTVKTFRLDHLRAGRSRSCGCLHNELAAVRTAVVAYRHGHATHPLYRTWWNMIDRCENPACSAFDSYGGRGITVCAGWHDVAAFIGWIEANLGPRPPGKSLDRIDNDGNYEAGNMRWATPAQQARNRRPRRCYRMRDLVIT